MSRRHLVLKTLYLPNDWIILYIHRQTHRGRNFGYRIKNKKFVENQRHFEANDGFRLVSQDTSFVENFGENCSILNVYGDSTQYIGNTPPLFVKNSACGKTFLKRLFRAVFEYNKGKMKPKRSKKIQLRERFIS